MSVKRVVDTQFWNDDKVVDCFSPEDKLFMLYLMTNPHTTQLGIYPVNEKVMAFELGYSLDTINILLERFENKYKIIKYSKDTKEIAIKNYLKYSIVKGGKPVEDLLTKEISKVKDKRLMNFVYDNVISYSNINESVKNILNKYNNDNVNDNDNDVSYHDSYDDSYHDMSKRFKKPSIEEIINYCKERNNNVNPNKFYDFYETKGWYVGKNKMKDWKACVRTWEQRDKKNNQDTSKLPDWFDKDFKERERTEDEERELQELIRGY